MRILLNKKKLLPKKKTEMKWHEWKKWKISTKPLTAHEWVFFFVNARSIKYGKACGEHAEKKQMEENKEGVIILKNIQFKYMYVMQAHEECIWAAAAAAASTHKVK